MTALTSLFLTVVLATHRWGWRPRLAVGGAGVLMGLFVVCWLAVQALHLPDMTAVFYGHGASPPTPVLWMNLVRGAALCISRPGVWSNFTTFCAVPAVPMSAAWRGWAS